MTQMNPEAVGVEDLKRGDKIFWKSSWKGYRFHPGPLTITKTWPKSRNIQVAEGDPSHCQYNFDSFFCYAYGTYKCTSCGHVGYLRSQKKKDAVCGKCYGPTEWVGLSRKP